MAARSEHGDGRRMHVIVRSAWIGAAIVAGVLAAGATALVATESPRLCAVCHEMSDDVDAWRGSAHTQVGCASCHEDPVPWQRFSETLAVRGSMLVRDVRAHFGDARASAEATTAIPDVRCESCHDPSRKVTLRYGTLIDHREHAERNGSCVSCHRHTAHPPAGAQKELLLMERCFDCHGQEPGAKADGACGVCHPPSFALRPESHGAAGWAATHGTAAKGDAGFCGMCHSVTGFCDSCHGVRMPHPAGWVDGAEGHRVLAASSRQTCSKCHKPYPDFCSMCHHTGYDPAKGPWVRQHPGLAKARGTAFCFECHAPTYCVTCHTTGRREEPLAVP